MKLFNLLYLVSVVVLLASCGSKYTASFGPSQKFYKPEAERSADVASAKGAPASEPVQMPESADRVDVAANNAPESYERAAIHGTVTASAKDNDHKAVKKPTDRMQEISDKYGNDRRYDEKNIAEMSKAEKRSLLKEVKRDLKEVKKIEKKEGISNRKIYIGIIIALAGLVLSILVSGSIGGLAILVGVILIVWGLIEQGTINL